MVRGCISYQDKASNATIAAKLLKEETNIEISIWGARRTLTEADLDSLREKGSQNCRRKIINFVSNLPKNIKIR